MQTARGFQTITDCKHISGYELTYKTIHNLKNFELTATAKLVLVLLTTHYNDHRNGAVVFPSIPYISETLGISQTATKQAIKDLISTGLIMKSKRSKIKGNYNKYLLTQKVQNPTCKQAENDRFKQTENDRSHDHEVEQKEIEQQHVVVSLTQTFSAKTEGETDSGRTIVSASSKVDETEIPDILKKRAEKGEIRNLIGYWKSLRPQAKAEWIEADRREKEEIRKKEAWRKIAEAEAKAKQEAELRAKKELSKPLKEQWTREVAERTVRTMLKLNPKSELAKNLIKTFNIDVNVL